MYKNMKKVLSVTKTRFPRVTCWLREKELLGFMLHQEHVRIWIEKYISTFFLFAFFFSFSFIFYDLELYDQKAQDIF
jgi:hypothetical protein